MIKVTGGAQNKRVKFATGQLSYTVAQDRFLNGTTTLWFRFDSTQAKWIETTQPVTQTVKALSQTAPAPAAMRVAYDDRQAALVIRAVAAPPGGEKTGMRSYDLWGRTLGSPYGK